MYKLKFRDWTVTKLFVAICCLVFVLQFFGSFVLKWFLFESLYTINPWMGIYNLIVYNYDYETQHFFVAISQGQIWRLVTPIFIHSNIFHLVFNLLLLFVLGRSVERNFPIAIYITMLIVFAVFTNTAQYLMTGPLFMGISGVVSALVGFLWQRKRSLTTWNDCYHDVDYGLILFLIYFIFFLLLLELAALFVNMLGILNVGWQVANTAHISGIFIGLVFATILEKYEH